MANRMIINHVSREMGARRIGIKAMADASGLSYDTVFRLWHGQVRRIDFATLDALCETLECGVADLFEYRRDPESKS